jgi:hypothetical protein
MTMRRRRTPLLRAALAAGVLGTLLPPSPVADAQVAVTRSRWWDDVARVEGLIAGEHWKKALRELEAVREELMWTSWREPDLGEVLAELAFQAAVARANLGEDEEAIWEWHVALNHERLRGRRELAGRDLASFGRAGALLAAHPLRAAEEAPPGVELAELRPDRDFEPPAAPEGFAVEPLVNSGAAQERPAPVILEALIDSEGRLQQPVLVSGWSHPVVLQWALDNLRGAGPFHPARMAGEPVASLWHLELGLDGGGPFGERRRRRGRQRQMPVPPP